MSDGTVRISTENFKLTGDERLVLNHIFRELRFYMWIAEDEQMDIDAKREEWEAIDNEKP